MQCLNQTSKQLVRLHSGVWTRPQLNYSTIKKEISYVALCISKFEDYLYYKKFLFKIDCKNTKEV